MKRTGFFLLALATATAGYAQTSYDFCSRADTSSTAGTASTPCATWRSRTARSPPSPPDIPAVAGDEDRRCRRPVRDARPRRHPRARVHRRRRRAIRAAFSSVPPGRLHARELHHHGGRRRQLRAGATSRTSRRASSTSRKTRVARLPQHRRPRHGRRGRFEQNLADMEAKPTAEMALKHKGVIVGIKSAHFNGPEWTRTSSRSRRARWPTSRSWWTSAAPRVRTIAELFTKYFRPGDIYTHVYPAAAAASSIDGKVNPAMIEAQKKGHHLRRRPRRRELRVSDRRARRSRKASTRTRSRPTCTSAA